MEILGNLMQLFWRLFFCALCFAFGYAIRHSQCDCSEEKLLKHNETVFKRWAAYWKKYKKDVKDAFRSKNKTS